MLMLHSENYCVYILSNIINLELADTFSQSAQCHTLCTADNNNNVGIYS